MHLGALASGRAAACCTAAALAAGLAGCGTQTTSGTTVTGSKLTVYSSVPTSDRDVYDAEALALKQQGDRVGKTFTVVLKPAMTGDTTAQISHNARVAISNKSTIAYLGESVPGTSGTSLQITNQVGILQVSPTDNALELSQSTAAVSGGLNHYYPSQSTYHYTFGRVVPSGAKEAAALVSEMQALGASKVYVADDGQPYGKAIALAVTQAAKAAKPALTVVSSPSGADAAFYGTNSAAAAVKQFTADSQANPQLKLFAPSAVDAAAFASSLPASAQPHTYITAPGTLPAAASATATTFAGDFKTAYGHAPESQAIFGYEAMVNLLKVLQGQGVNAGDRANVVSAFTGLKDPGSATTPWQFVILHFKAGQLVPFKSVPTG
jgi:branched-chain amino acid transport system substrate-binding protein